MKTVARHGDKAEILRRLRVVGPDRSARWGRMSAHQMICHLSDSFLMATGQKPVGEAGGLLHHTFLKWIVLYVPLRWPAGILTRPEIDQEIGGTRPVDFAADVATLETLLERIATQFEKHRRAGSSRVRQDVGSGLASLGVPPHGPPPSTIRCVEPNGCGAALQGREHEAKASRHTYQKHANVPTWSLGL